MAKPLSMNDAGLSDAYPPSMDQQLSTRQLQQLRAAATGIQSAAEQLKQTFRHAPFKGRHDAG